ncbi:MAG: hypothetical protein KR126chlam1_00406 [Chlamydiae bacterium]|nr:hypothetical protein [Chlamydiota bacterium]
MNLKSERLKKLETELADLQQWLKLGLVPKKDIEKHKVEIGAIEQRIVEEKDRLRLLKESGEVEEFTPPKRTARPAYQEPQSMPEMAAANEGTSEGGGFDTETESFNAETATGEEEKTSPGGDETPSQVYDDDDDPFSDKNRWKRGILKDPDTDEW